MNIKIFIGNGQASRNMQQIVSLKMKTVQHAVSPGGKIYLVVVLSSIDPDDINKN